MSNSLWPHGLQHARLHCPLLSLRVCSIPCPLSQWGNPTISSSVIPFSSCPQSLSVSGSFPLSRLFASGGQNIGASVSASVQWIFRVDFQVDFPGLTGLISLLSKGLSRVFSSTRVRRHQFFSTQAFFMAQLSHLYMTTGKTVSLIIQTFISKVMSLRFNMRSRFVIAFLPRSKRLLISWLQSLSTVIFEPKKIKSATVSTFSPSLCHGTRCLSLRFLWMLSFKPAFSLYLFTLIKRLFSSFSLSAFKIFSPHFINMQTQKQRR